MKNKNKTIHLGYTFDFFGPAVILIVGGGACFLVSCFLAAGVELLHVFSRKGARLAKVPDVCFSQRHKVHKISTHIFICFNPPYPCHPRSIHTDS